MHTEFLSWEFIAIRFNGSTSAKLNNLTAKFANLSQTNYTRCIEHRKGIVYNLQGGMQINPDLPALANVFLQRLNALGLSMARVKLELKYE